VEDMFAGCLPFRREDVDVVESGMMKEGVGIRVVSLPRYVCPGTGGEVDPKSLVEVIESGSWGDNLGEGVFPLSFLVGERSGLGFGDADAERGGFRICKSGFKRWVSCLKNLGAIVLYIRDLVHYELA
jgi:hypothetical protein